MEYERPQTDKKFTQTERHHSIGAWKLILAEDSRYSALSPKRSENFD